MELISEENFVVQSYLDQNPLVKELLIQAFQKALYTFCSSPFKSLRQDSIVKLPAPELCLKGASTKIEPVQAHYSSQEKLLKALEKYPFSLEENTYLSFDYLEDGKKRFQNLWLHMSFLGDTKAPQLNLIYPHPLHALQRTDKGKKFLDQLKNTVTQSLQSTFY